MEPVLCMEDVALGYGPEPILSGVNLTVQASELLVIAGGSGNGKSTLLKGAIGLLEPLAGRVSLFGKSLAGLDESGLSRMRRQAGFLFQGGALINSMTVAENVALPVQQFTRMPAPAVRKLVIMKLAQVGLEEHGHKTPPELSGGMRKRAALARALVLDPPLLLCDEPSAGLDPVTAAALDQLLLDLRATMNMTLVVVTHELGSIQAIADRVVMVAEGGLVFDGSLAEAQRSTLPVVEDFFARRAAQDAARGPSVWDRLCNPVQEVKS